MIKVLKELLSKISPEHPAKKTTSILGPKRSNTGGDFRAVSIAPSIMCCSAAMRATERTYLLRDAPRLPLAACTMPNIFRASIARMPTAAKAIDACSERRKQTAGLRASKAAGGEFADPPKSDSPSAV